MTDRNGDTSQRRSFSYNEMNNKTAWRSRRRQAMKTDCSLVVWRVITCH